MPGTLDTTIGSTSGGVLDNDAGESPLEDGVDGVGVLESERVCCSRLSLSDSEVLEQDFLERLYQCPCCSFLFHKRNSSSNSLFLFFNTPISSVNWSHTL